MTATALLAQLGAEVVQVTSCDTALAPEDPVRVWADRHKTVGARLTWDGDTAAVRALAASADAVVSDLPPVRLEAMGVGPAAVDERNAGSVHVWMPPYGPVGRWSALEPDPLLLAAVSGFADHHPAVEDRPVAPVVPTLGYLHGALGAAATLAGLVARQRTGLGRTVTVSGLHAAGAALATLMAKGLDNVTIVSTGRSTRGTPFFRLYQGGDGSWFYLAALSPAIFFRALDVLGRMDVMVRDDVGGEFSNLVRPEVAAAVHDELERTIAARPAADWVRDLQQAGVPAAPVWTRETWTSSDLGSAATPPIETVSPELGPVTLPAPPIQMAVSGSVPAAGRSRTPAPVGGGPLEGVRVVDLSTFLAAPFAAALFADFGADVVKVEPLDGDPYRIFGVSHAVANQHKRMAALDLRRSGARAAFLRLVEGADILVDNMQEASLRRLGLGEEVLAGCNPGLVRGSLSAFGTGHAWSATPGFDPVLQALTGLAAAQGGSANPSPSSAPVVDVAAGTIMAVGTLAALYSRQRTGTVYRVRTSLAAAAVFLQSAEMTRFPGRPPAASGGTDFSGPTPWWRYYATQDGWIAVAAHTPSQREAFEELVRSRGRSKPGLDDTTAIEALIAAETQSSWLNDLASSGIPAASVLKRAVGIDDSYLTANRFSHVLDVPTMGTFRVVRSYADWSTSRRPAARASPVGAHTAEVLAEAGVTDQELTALREEA